MKIDLLGGSYKQKYPELNSQRTINRYVVPGLKNEKDKSQSASFPTPGLTTFVHLPGRYVRCLWTAVSHDVHRCFAIVDTTLYEVLPNKSFVSYGKLTNLAFGTTKVYLAMNDNDQMFLGHPSAAYVFNLATNVLTQVTDVLFPGDCEYVTSTDGYIILTSAGSVFGSQLNDALNFTLGFTYAPTWKAAKTTAVESLREEIYNFTKQTIEIYLNDGVSPYSRLPRSTIYVGLLAKDSLVVWNDGFLFLGTDAEGESAIYYFDGWYTAQPVSTFSITWALNRFTTDQLTNAYGYLQRTKDGHVWYYLTVPVLKTTFVYDFTTKEFQERQSKQPFNDVNGDNVYREFRGKHFTNFKGLNLFADLYSGKIFFEDWTNQTEDFETIKRVRTSQTFSQDYQQIAVSRLEIDCNTGYGNNATNLTWDTTTTTFDVWTNLWNLPFQDVNYKTSPLLTLEYSKDGGYNWFQPRSVRLGVQGDHLFRAKINNLGSARNWIFRLTDTDPTDLMFQNAVARGDVSSY